MNIKSLKFWKKFFLSLAILLSFSPQAVFAIGKAVNINLFDRNTLQDMQDQGERTAVAYGNTTNETTLTQYVADVINVFFGLLGTIFIILVIVAGYNWMTAAGNADKVSKAQTTLKVAIIGIIIIASAYAITYFVFKRLPDSSPQGY